MRGIFLTVNFGVIYCKCANLKEIVNAHVRVEKYLFLILI